MAKIQIINGMGEIDRTVEGTVVWSTPVPTDPRFHVAHIEPVDSHEIMLYQTIRAKQDSGQSGVE